MSSAAASYATISAPRTAATVGSGPELRLDISGNFSPGCRSTIALASSHGSAADERAVVWFAPLPTKSALRRSPISAVRFPVSAEGPEAEILLVPVDEIAKY